MDFEKLPPEMRNLLILSMDYFLSNSDSGSSELEELMMLCDILDENLQEYERERVLSRTENVISVDFTPHNS